MMLKKIIKEEVRGMLRRFMYALAMSLVFCLYSLAQAGTLEVKSVAEVEVMVKDEKGELIKKRIEADKANVGPGDEVIFTNYLMNNGDKPATDLVIVNPVPEHTVYVSDSAGGDDARIEFSIDGGKTFGPPENLRVKEKDGSMRLAKPEEYTHIRWIITKPLEPGRVGKVFFKARIK